MYLREKKASSLSYENIKYSIHRYFFGSKFLVSTPELVFIGGLSALFSPSKKEKGQTPLYLIYI